MTNLQIKNNLASQVSQFLFGSNDGFTRSDKSSSYIKVYTDCWKHITIRISDHQENPNNRSPTTDINVGFGIDSDIFEIVSYLSQFSFENYKNA